MTATEASLPWPLPSLWSSTPSFGTTFKLAYRSLLTHEASQYLLLTIYLPRGLRAEDHHVSAEYVALRIDSCNDQVKPPKDRLIKDFTLNWRPNSDIVYVFQTDRGAFFGPILGMYEKQTVTHNRKFLYRQV